MSAETLAEIRLSDHPKDPTQKVLRILRDRYAAGRFFLIEADPKWIAESIETGEPIEWRFTPKMSSLTPDELGALIASIVQERSDLSDRLRAIRMSR